jgi:NCAIR mutase (PurE)-related protein
MDEKIIKNILNQVASGEISKEEGFEKLKNFPNEDIGFANIDQHRNIRTGYPEAIFCLGKTKEQVLEIMKRLCENNANVIATRATPEMYEYLKDEIKDAIYYEAPKMIIVNRNKEVQSEKIIAIVTGGTADIPVAEEAAITCEVIGNKVDRIYDVGVAGIHRLLSKSDRLQNANVIIVIAGMEGALASVVGGLVNKPVIAVPTSIGYGASFGGLAALLAMLNSCATGIGVVNIDNGFGAAYLASNINRL